jgi:hypothetical protein
MKRFNVGIDDKQARRRAVEWCYEHGINPNMVSLFARVDVLDEEHLEIEVYETTASGQQMWDEKTQTPQTRWLHVRYQSLPEGLLVDE